ncbi:MAG: ComEC/Rec2 family competence protein [bacterium]
MSSLNLSLIKLTCSLVIGILLSSIIRIPIIYSLAVLLVLTLTIGICNILSQRKVISQLISDSFILLTAMWLGITLVKFHNPIQYDSHYSKKVLNKEGATDLVVQISEILKRDLYNDKYVAKVRSIENSKVTGKILLNLTIDTTQNNLQIDDFIHLKSDLFEIPEIKNPHQFDYKKYLSRKHITHQVYTSYDLIVHEQREAISIRGWASRIKQIIQNKLEEYSFRKDELSIINAMLLGERNYLSSELRTSYINAGAIHILAISGLHVGIILVLFNWLLKPVELLPKGKKIKTILLLLSLWSYACIAGLSPSIIRAATMFSVFTIALNLKRKTNIYNTIVASIFILLLFNPLYIYDVGFQLSYLAVLGIVTFEPIFSKLWKPKMKVTNVLWKTLTVSTAAQIGILPISLFYFHQFPGLFFLTNLVVIPLLGFIIALGIVVIILSLVNFLPDLLVKIYGKIIQYLNEYIEWIGKKEDFLFQEIPFDLLDVIISYLVIIGVYWFLKLKSFNILTTSLMLILIFQSKQLLHRISYDEEMTVFHKSRKTIIGKKLSNELVLYHNLDSLNEVKSILSNYKINNRISSITEKQLTNVMIWKKDTMLIVDKSGIYQNISLSNSVILIRDSPKVNLERLIDSIHPKLILCDGSNYKSYIQRWKTTCLKRKIPFHSTSEKGAYIFKKE